MARIFLDDGTKVAVEGDVTEIREALSGGGMFVQLSGTDGEIVVVAPAHVTKVEEQ